jgi:hypothetical protein
MGYHNVLPVSFTVTLLTPKPQTPQRGQEKPGQAHLTLVKRKSGCGPSGGNVESTHSGNCISQRWLPECCLQHHFVQSLILKIFILN